MLLHLEPEGELLNDIAQTQKGESWDESNSELVAPLSCKDTVCCSTKKDS